MDFGGEEARDEGGESGVARSIPPSVEEEEKLLLLLVTEEEEEEGTILIGAEEPNSSFSEGKGESWSLCSSSS